MSVIVQTRGKMGGGVTSHLECPCCGHFSKSHARKLSHIATAHPSCLDDVPVGRLGNILMFQSTAQLFHCTTCFYTSRDFTKLYKHIITKHCEVDGGQKEKTGEQGEHDVKESLKRKRDSGTDEEEEGNEEEVASQKPESVTPDGEVGESILLFDGTNYCCSICGWKHKVKPLVFNHVVRKHNFPIRREADKEELEATAKVISFVSNSFVCLTCGWKTPLKGFAIGHVIRSHDVVRPYTCKDCTRSFLLPSHLQRHIRSAHRPGRYACPFCCFRSHFLVGFRWHCSCCNAQEEEEEEGERGVDGGGDDEAEEIEEEEREERKDTRAESKRRRLLEETEEQVEDEDDDDE